MEVSEWDHASFFAKYSYSVANRMLQIGMERPLQENDLLTVPIDDHSDVLLKRLKFNYHRSQNFFFIPKLMVALIKTNYIHAIIASIFCVLEGATRVSLPVVLIYFLRALEHKDKTYAYVYAILMGIIGFLQTFIHHVLFFYTMRAGWNWKTACTAFVHNALFSLNSGVLNSTGTGAGKLVNLISNDVQRFEEFAVVIDIISFLIHSYN